MGRERGPLGRRGFAGVRMTEIVECCGESDVLAGGPPALRDEVFRNL